MPIKAMFPALPSQTPRPQFGDDFCKPSQKPHSVCNGMWFEYVIGMWFAYVIVDTLGITVHNHYPLKSRNIKMAELRFQ